MADRIVRVLISAEVNSYLKGIDEVSKKTREGASDAELLTRKLEAQKKAFQVVGKSMLAAGGVIAAGLILATKRAAEFDQAMSNVQAATHESADNMALLRAAALEAGADTVYSAKEAAGAIEELAKAGLSTKSIIGGGLTGALNLAAAGGLEVADAAGIASTTLQQFGLEGNKASHVADVLAAGAGKAMGDVSDLSMALSQSGTVAAQFGLSLEETTGSLAAFASKGLLGSDAGTSFRSMLLRLANPTGEAAKKMQELGIQAYDAQGNFIGMTGLAGQLEKGLGSLSQEQRNAALAIIFGQDAIRAANVLYTEGAKGIAKWTKEVDDAGYAGETAAARLDNLNGDLEKLSGAFDTALITVGGAGQGPLRMVVQGITELVDGFNGMPEGAQVAVYWVGAVGAAVALAGGTFLIAVPKVAAFKAAVADLSPAAQGASRALASLASGVAILAGAGAAAAALGAGVRALEGTDRKITELAGANKALGESLTYLDDVNDGFDLSSGMAGLVKLQENGWSQITAIWDGAVRDGIDLRDSLGELGSGLGTLASSNLPSAQAQFRKWAESTDGSKEQMIALLNAMGPYREVLEGVAKTQGIAITDTNLLKLAQGDATSAAKTAADAYLDQANKVNGVRDALRNLYDEMNAGNSAQQKAIQANADFLDGLAGIAKNAEDAGTSLDEATAAGSKNAAMLAGIAGDAQAAAQAQYEVEQKTIGVDEANKNLAIRLGDSRQKFVDAAIAAGYNADQVKALADRVFALPDKRSLDIIADTTKAMSAVDQLIRDISQKRAVLVVDQQQGTVVRPGQVGMYASGGPVFGPGSGTSDSIPAYLSNGEYVINARAAAANRPLLDRINYGVQRFAGGGFVQPQYAQGTPWFTQGGGGRPVVEVTQNIHPSRGMSEAEVGRVSAERMRFAAGAA